MLPRGGATRTDEPSRGAAEFTSISATIRSCDAGDPTVIAWAQPIWRLPERTRSRALGTRLPSARRCSTTFLSMPKVSAIARTRSEEHKSELQSLMRISYAVFYLKKKTTTFHVNHIQ